MNPAVHPILYLPEYGNRPSTKPECSWACSLFNHIKSCSELMVSNLLWVYDSLSKALHQGHFPLWCWVQSQNAELIFPDTSALFAFLLRKSHSAGDKNCNKYVLLFFLFFVLSRWAQWDGLSNAREGQNWKAGAISKQVSSSFCSAQTWRLYKLH